MPFLNDPDLYYYHQQMQYLQMLGQRRKVSATAKPTNPPKKRHPYQEVKMPQIEVYKTGGMEKELMLFTVSRVSEGLKVKAKSPQLEKFFKEFKPAGEGSGIQKIAKWGNLPVVMMEKFPVVENATFERPGDHPMINEYIVNLSFLRAEKLGEGIDFVFKGVWSKSQAESFYNAAKTAITELFLEYLQNTEYEFQLTGKSSL